MAFSIRSLITLVFAIVWKFHSSDAFGITGSQSFLMKSYLHDGNIGSSHMVISSSQRNKSWLEMSDSGGGGGGNMERSKSKKRGLTTITIDKVKLEEKEDIKDETEWRVLLHNDEVHTFEYVVESLVKVIGTIDRKQAWDMCVLTHGNGKATVTKAWKDQAEKYCLGLQRQGLTASIAPDDNFQGKGMSGDLGGPGKSGD